MNSETFTKLLHDRDLKATGPRLNLLCAMYNYETAMPYSAIQKTMNSTDRVTLYRTIENLKKKGIIHKAFQENNEVYYAICGTSCKKEQHTHNHIHFKCLECDQVTCEQTKTNLKISIPEYIINKTSIYLEGICKSCKNLSVT